MPAWSLDVIENMGRGKREYWVQFCRAAYERKEKKNSDLISKLAEHAAGLLGARRRK